MKHNRNEKLFGLAFILAIGLTFIGIDFVQGQAHTQDKPNNQPGKGRKDSYVWRAVILNNPGSGLKGIDTLRYEADWPGWVFDDSESNVNVDVEIRRAPFDGVEKYWTRFFLEIFYPVQVDFNFSPPYDAWFPQARPDALCKYPGDYLSTDPMSMLYFLQNSYHPHPNYQKVYFKFNTGRSVNRDEIDFTQWTYHEHMSFLGQVRGPDPPGTRSVPCEEYELFEHSTIEFGGGEDDPGNYGDDKNDYGYFERIDEDIWKVVVGTEIFPPYDYTTGLGDRNGWAYDWYNICVESQIHKNKTVSTYDSIWSAQGSLDMKFEVLFIRTMR